MRFACSVCRLILRSLSRKIVAMSVALSRFFMSSLARDSSSTLPCSSMLTVCSSSLSDCISSFEVSSSSFALCSSSLVDCSSSLVDFSSSFVGLELLDRALMDLLRLRELVLEVGDALARAFGALYGTGVEAGGFSVTVLEGDEKESAQRFGLGEPPDAQFDRGMVAVAL